MWQFVAVERSHKPQVSLAWGYSLERYLLCWWLQPYVLFVQLQLAAFWGSVFPTSEASCSLGVCISSVVLGYLRWLVKGLPWLLQTLQHVKVSSVPQLEQFIICSCECKAIYSPSNPDKLLVHFLWTWASQLNICPSGDLSFTRLSHSSWCSYSNPLQFLQWFASCRHSVLLVTACSHYHWEALLQPGFIVKSLYF